MQVRIKKFGAQTEEVKKITRAERFGTKAEENGASAKLNERAARFGIETKEAKAASAAAVDALTEECCTLTQHNNNKHNT